MMPKRELLKPTPNEEWKPVVSYDNLFVDLYEVSSLGRVRRNFHDGYVRYITLKPDPYQGYTYCKLSNNKKVKCVLVHRLVAEAFIPNPENKPTVDHRNQNKLDNSVSNLRWTTYKEQAENMPECSKDIRYGKVRLIEHNIIFDSAYQAAKYLQVSKNGISGVLNERLGHTAAGYHWEYYKEPIDELLDDNIIRYHDS